MQIRRFSLKTEYKIEFLPPFNSGKKLLEKFWKRWIQLPEFALT